MSVELRSHRFNLEQYEAMIEHGILTRDDRVELLAGEIVEVDPIGSPHAACVDRLTKVFITMPGDDAIVRAQNPVALPPNSEPEPDLCLLLPRADFYATGHPRGDSVLLVVEVADTSLRLDRLIKGPLYAAAGIQEYWIVDLAGKRLERYTEIKGQAYVHRTVLKRGEVLSPLAFPHFVLNVSDIVPG